MTYKNLAIFSSLVGLAYGLPLLFAPQAIIDMYSTDKSSLSGIALHVCRGYGALLTAVGIGGFTAMNAMPSIARRGILVITVINTGLATILNFLAVNNGVENNMAWGTVLVVGIIAVWSGWLLSQEKIEK